MTEMLSHLKKNWQAQPEENIGEDERAISALAGGALALYGLRRGTGGLLLTGLGAALVYRGLTGRSAAYRALGLTSAGPDALPAPQPLTVTRAETVERPREELYRHWRNFENLPAFMQHLESVTALDERRSRWAAKAPLGTRVEWDAEIVEDRPGELIAWRSLPGAQVPSAGRVEFREATGGRGTVVRVQMEYTPPGGALGALAALVAGEEPHKQVADDLRNFKALMEAGEVPTTRGQPSGRGMDEPDPRAARLLARAGAKKGSVA